MGGPKARRRRRITRAVVAGTTGLLITIDLAVIGMEAHAHNSGFLTPLWRSETGMILHNPKPAFGHRQASHRVWATATREQYGESLEHLPLWAGRSTFGTGHSIHTWASGWPLPAFSTV